MALLTGTAGAGAPDDHSPSGAALARAFADEWGRVVATLVRVTGDWALAEDAAQDAFASAAARWERDGVPDRPGAWLTTAARNAALDRIRRAASQRRRLVDHAVLARAGDGWGSNTDDEEGDEVFDDRLRLVVTCCHPALPLDARVALTLRTLCGLTVADIARAFGTTDAAMAKRLVRARQKITHARIPYRVPRGPELGGRLPGVLAVLYLLFTEGYAPTSGDAVVRGELTGEAVRLTRVLAELVPDEPEVHGLLALELLHDSRRAARQTPDGDVVPLDEQDRSLWDAGLVCEGLAALAVARTLAQPAGPYVLQAEIAACHATAATPATTDTRRIAVLYDALAQVLPTPYVRLARAMAIAAVDGQDAGLALLPDLSEELPSSHLVPAAEADLERRAGRPDRAADAYRRALTRAPAGPTRRFLERRLAAVTRTWP